MKDFSARQLLNMTRESYDGAAGEFSASRAKFWEELEYLLTYAKPQMRVLDIGCGNGRLYPLLKKRGANYTGVDNSEGLLKEARALHPEARFVECDATALPFPSDSFNLAYSLAALHHMPGLKLRHKFIQEAARVLKPESIFIFTVWDLWTMGRLPALIFSFVTHFFSDLDAKDLFLDLGRAKHKRYLHAFTKSELRKLLEKNGFTVESLNTVARKSGARNIVVVAKKYRLR